MYLKLNKLMIILKEAKAVIANAIEVFKLQIDDDGLTGENVCYFDDSEL